MVDTGCPRNESEGVSVVDESKVGFRETAADVEPEAGCDTYGFAYEAKFLNDASDIRGAFQGKRRITIQL